MRTALRGRPGLRRSANRLPILKRLESLKLPQTLFGSQDLRQIGARYHDVNIFAFSSLEIKKEMWRISDEVLCTPGSRLKKLQNW
jgi:hypothetical protein